VAKGSNSHSTSPSAEEVPYETCDNGKGNEASDLSSVQYRCFDTYNSTGDGSGPAFFFFFGGVAAALSAEFGWFGGVGSRIGAQVGKLSLYVSTELGEER
jgi:hypothetical protein